MNRIHDIETTLRSMDPATPPADLPGARARQDLEHILGTDPGSAGPRARTGARTVRRVALAGGGLAAVTAGMVVLPPLTGGDEAFATWTARPSALTPQGRAEAVDSCHDSFDHVPDDELAQLGRADAVIAERRGVWTTVVLAGAEGFSATCITDDSASFFDHGMIGSIGTPAGYSAPGPRELLATSLGTGTMGAGDISVVEGVAGSDVVGVVYRSGTHGDVTATVSGGHFALWFPGDELEDAARDGVDLEVTYRDGTTTTSNLTL